MEGDMYGVQKKVWKMLGNRKCEINDTKRIIEEEENNDESINISHENVRTSLLPTKKNRKHSGQDEKVRSY